MPSERSARPEVRRQGFAVVADREQVRVGGELVVGGGGEAGEGAELGVRDPLVGERVRGRGEGAQLTADANPFAGGARLDVGHRGEPVGGGR